MTILEGTVRDEQGRAESGANVYARAAFDGGMRMAEWIDATTTDGQGRYRLLGARMRMMDSPVVIAHAEGRPPAMGYAPPPGDDGRPAALDLTLPDAGRGGSVRVTVLRDGEPLAGANVSLYRQGPVSLESRMGRGAVAGPAQKRCRP